jgi:hypothetical protein
MPHMDTMYSMGIKILQVDYQVRTEYSSTGVLYNFNCTEYLVLVP